MRINLHILKIIEKKRDKLGLTQQEIEYLVQQYVAGAVPDYQIAAFLMATCINGMSEEEISWLTSAMLHSGEVIEHNALGGPLVDKHSTGGVGDKISIPLAPAMAACGLRVPMIAGRGLGHTGGTLDKLESIPGFRCELKSREYQDVVERVGCVIMGATDKIVPADRKFYALRDVTATVPSLALLSSSIMSKKLAEGIDALVLDVKFGSGAFMQTKNDAKSLAHAMVAIGDHLGKKVTARLTNMDQPLGRMVGNALEIAESIDILKGSGPKDSTDLTVLLGAEMLLLGNMATSLAEGRKQVEEALSSGRAFNKFVEMVKAQGGNIEVLHQPSKLPQAPNKIEILASDDGFVEAIDCRSIGLALNVLGGGRCQLTDTIDHSVGIEALIKIGDKLEKHQPMFLLHTNGKGVEEAKSRVLHAISLCPHPVTKSELCHDRITNKNLL